MKENISLKMNELIDVDGEFHLTSTKFCLEYNSIIDKHILYKYISGIIDRKNVYIVVAQLMDKTYVLVNLDKQPNWKRRTKFCYKQDNPKIYVIKGSFSAEIDRYCDLYPPYEERPKKICCKCKEEKEIYHFSSDKNDCKKCEPLSGETIKQLKIAKNIKDIKDPIEFCETLFALHTERISKLEKEIVALRKTNELYLHHIANMYNLSEERLIVKPSIVYKSGFTVIYLGSAFILANTKNVDVIHEFIPPGEYMNNIMDKGILYYGYHNDTSSLVDILYDHFVVKHGINTDFAEIITINISKDVADKISDAFMSFINDEYMKDNFIGIKSMNSKVKSENVVMCSKKMISIVKYFLSKQIKLFC